MPDIYNIPSDFLRQEGFTVLRDDHALSKAFDENLDQQNPTMYIDAVDGTVIDEQFTPSEILYRLARREYDRAYSQWSTHYKLLKDGSCLHEDDAQAAWDCWSIEMEKKESKWKEKSEK